MKLYEKKLACRCVTLRRHLHSQRARRCPRMRRYCQRTIKWIRKALFVPSGQDAGKGNNVVACQATDTGYSHDTDFALSLFLPKIMYWRRPFDAAFTMKNGKILTKRLRFAPITHAGIESKLRCDGMEENSSRLKGEKGAGIDIDMFSLQSVDLSGRPCRVQSI